MNALSGTVDLSRGRAMPAGVRGGEVVTIFETIGIDAVAVMAILVAFSCLCYLVFITLRERSEGRRSTCIARQRTAHESPAGYAGLRRRRQLSVRTYKT